MAGNDFVEVVYTKECENVAKVLKKAGFLDKVKSFKPKNRCYKGLMLSFTKENGQNKISDIKRISKPGRRLYIKGKDIRPVLNGFGIAVVSTSRGVMNSMEAKKKKLGGEILCEIY